MKIELKNFKYAAFASQETHCYEATVYVDGKKAFYASNEGHGGGDSYRGIQTGWADKEIIAAIAADKRVEVVGDEEWLKDADDYTIVEIFIGNLVNDTLMTRDLKKKLKKKVLFTHPDGLSEIGYGGRKPADAALIDSVQKQYPDALVLNNLPFDEAMTIYLENAA